MRAAPGASSYRLLAVFFGALLILFPHQAMAEGVALTYDDLPQLGLTDSVDYARVTNRRLLAGLRRHHMPAIGFVIGDKIEGKGRVARIEILKAWLNAGQMLGNHTYQHDALNDTPMPEYIASIARTEAALEPLLAAHRQRARWFRHPYLETGPTEVVRDGVELWLKSHGYRTAPVTLENSDWMFALPYDEALAKGDTSEARRIKQAYIDYTALVVPWYRRAAAALFDRPIPLVFLLHASRINADSVDDLAGILRRNHLKATTLTRVTKDPAYRTPDGVADRDGDEWLSRWSEVLHKDLPWESFPEPPADIAAADQRLDPEP